MPKRPSGEPSESIVGPRPEVRRVAPRDLDVPDFLDILSGVVGGEPFSWDLEEALAAGRQPYPAEVVGNTLVYGVVLVLAARKAGGVVLDAVRHPEWDGLSGPDLALVMAGRHLAGVRRNTHPDPFDDRLVAAEVYRFWATHAPRAARGGGRGSMPAGPAAGARRQALVKGLLGKSQRALERDAKLLVLDTAALAAVRAGRIPVRAVEAVAKLGPADQAGLAARLAAGGTFAALEAEAFGNSGGRRKTPRGAGRAILAAVRTIAAEADGWTDLFALRSEDRPAAEKAADALGRLLAGPVPRSPAGERVAAPQDQTADPAAGDVAPAPRGGRPEGGRS